MDTVISHNRDETEAIGLDWAAKAAAGWVVGLMGDLGAGKTQLIKGLARGLGSRARVSSPTFTLVNIYDDGWLALYHLDLYRLESQEAIERAGLDEYFAPNGITVVEWADRWQGPFPPFYRRVVIEILDEQRRAISYEDFSA